MIQMINFSIIFDDNNMIKSYGRQDMSSKQIQPVTHIHSEQWLLLGRWKKYFFTNVSWGRLEFNSAPTPINQFLHQAFLSCSFNCLMHQMLISRVFSLRGVLALCYNILYFLGTFNKISPCSISVDKHLVFRFALYFQSSFISISLMR